MEFFFEILFLIILSIIVIISLSGYGRLIIFKYEHNFLESTFFGFIVISALITLVHFFIKIEIIISLIVILIGCLIEIKYFTSSKIENKKKLFFYLFIFLILLPIYISQKYHEDFGYYHLPYVINVVNEKVIFGMANLNEAFVHNSIWLNTISLLYLKNNFNYLTILTFINYYLFITFSFIQIFYSFSKKISFYFLIVSSFYLILKFTRISEYGNDIPSLIFSILSIYYFFKFNEEQNELLKKKFFYYNLSFAFFAILIKLSSIPILLLTAYLFLKNFKILIVNILNFNYLFIYFLFFIFYLQQFIYTGCFFFPSQISCVDVSWFNENYLNTGKKLEIINKSYYSTGANKLFSKEEYLKNLNWIIFWLKRNYNELIENLLTMIVPVILFFSLLKNSQYKKEIKTSGYLAFLLFIIVGFVFWLSYSPVYRFGIVYFLSIISVLVFYLYKNKIFNNRTYAIIFLLFIFFNFSKNLFRIKNENNIFVGIKKIHNTYTENTQSKNSIIGVWQPDIAKNAKRGNGWQAMLCWDIKFICSKNQVLIKKKNNYLIISPLKLN